jgi:hypothetical protein
MLAQMRSFIDRMMISLMCGGLLADRRFSKSTTDACSRVILLPMACMLPYAAMLAFANTVAPGLACLTGAIFFLGFQGGLPEA